MRVIKDGKAQDDSWTLVGPEESVPDTGDVIVPAPRWRSSRAALLQRSARVALWVDSHEAIEGLAQEPNLPLIGVNFPKFADGRGYTLARVLRREGYLGELRALGDVLRDQLFLMRRCGFDSFALKAGKDEQLALAAFEDFSVCYQGAADDARPLFQRVQRG